MKYKIAFILFMVISILCMSCGNSSTAEQSTTDSSDNFSYYPDELPFSMPYYDGEIIIKDLYIVEDYKDYEYNADYLLRVDVSNLSDKDYHWFKEETLNLFSGAIFENKDSLSEKGKYSISVNDVFIRFPIYRQKRDSITTGKCGYVNLFYSCDDIFYSMNYSFDFGNVLALSELKEIDTDIYNFFYGKYVRELTQEEIERVNEPIIEY